VNEAKGQAADRWAGIAFVVSALASLALTVVYVFGGQPQLEGALLGIALGGLAVGLALIAEHMLPEGGEVQERGPLFVDEEDRREVLSAFGRGRPVARRRFLARAFGGAIAALGLATVFPIRSLGERPGRLLFHTMWRTGSRMVTEDGDLVRATDLTVGGVLTVFPEGHEKAADSQTLLLRLPLDVPAPGPPDVTDEGLCAFSKICTHAGCPVGLYQATTQELFCPCHQSIFDVRAGAEPTAGPATRPLPQLPLEVDAEGFVVAKDDYPEPVGPGFWNRGRD
jgi:ubiquinol-cytochrome c reductase iron-sulfur subunit